MPSLAAWPEESPLQRRAPTCPGSHDRGTGKAALVLRGRSQGAGTLGGRWGGPEAGGGSRGESSVSGRLGPERLPDLENSPSRVV